MPDSGINLTRFFEALETNFPLSGVRTALSKKVGQNVVAALERAGLLTYLRVSDTYPCPQPGALGCPRQIVQLSDDRITAVCGNVPPECEDIELTAKDIEFLGVLPKSLCEALRGPLYFGGKTERVSELDNIFRAGTFKPRPSIRKSIYFGTRCSTKDYSILLDVLRSRHGSEGFALLVPTDRFVSEETIREAAAKGIVVLPLAEIIGMDASGKLVAKDDAAELLAGIGRIGSGPMGSAGRVYAQVLTKDGWKDLDVEGYRELLTNMEQYDTFADEHTKEIRKRTTERSPGRKTGTITPPSRVPASYFQVIRDAVQARGYYDPTVVEEKDSGKQIFQRARAAIDMKVAGGTSHWKLFKTVNVDNRSVYQFQPDQGITFALIFLPRN